MATTHRLKQHYLPYSFSGFSQHFNMNQTLQSNTTPTISRYAIGQRQVIIDGQVLKTQGIVLRLVVHRRVGTVHVQCSVLLSAEVFKVYNAKHTTASHLASSVFLFWTDVFVGSNNGFPVRGAQLSHGTT